MDAKERVYIFDTTLRDGQQAPSAGMSFEDNLEYAKLANELGVDVLEAGFPSASENDFRNVYGIASMMASMDSKMIITGFCQLREAQIERTMESLEPLLSKGSVRIHTYVPVDPQLMTASLGSRSVN